MLHNTGSALIDGLDIRSDMADIYAMMGVCPQHDLLWETLTGREHLLFYGRLKHLKVQPHWLACLKETRLQSIIHVQLHCLYIH